MVGKQQLTVGVQCEASQLQGRVGDLLVPDDLAPLDLCPPDFACGVVAIDIGSAKLRQFLAVVHDAASKRPGFGMRVLERWLGYGCRPGLSIWIEQV